MDKEINYLGIFAVVGNIIQQKSNGLVYANRATHGWNCMLCKHYEKTAYGMLKHCYEHWRYYNEKSEPESDGQAEQHLGAVTEVWWDEMTQTVRECKPEQCNKYDNGKPRLDLVPPGIIEAVGVVRTYGIGKYGDSESWNTVEPSRYRAAMMRHLCAYLRDPKSKDEESGLSHLSHAACNIAFLLELEKEGKA